MLSCHQIWEAFMCCGVVTLLNVTLMILTLSVSKLLNVLVRLVAFLLFLTRECFAPISRWITASTYVMSNSLLDTAQGWRRVRRRRAIRRQARQPRSRSA